MAGVEFSEAAKQCSIFFTQAKDYVVPVTLLWCRNEGNFGVDDKGYWYERGIA